MDNQQATSWLSGIIEGEGSLTSERLRISNTELDLIEKCEEILRKLGIPYNRSSSQRGNRKREYDLCIWQNRIPNLLKHLKLECRFESSETTREGSVDLWWLIGILEAEGSFHICNRMSRKDQMNLNPEITLTSTTEKIISKVATNLYALGMSYHIQSYTPEKHTPYRVLTIRGYKRVQRFLLRVTEFQTKKYQQKATLLLAFCNTRLAQSQKEPYTERQLEIFRALRNMI